MATAEQLAALQEQMSQTAAAISQQQTMLAEVQRDRERERVEYLQKVTELQSQLLESRSAKPQRVTFVDTKGIGKPATFNGDNKNFGQWSFKLGNFLEGVVSGMKDALEWAQDQDEAIQDLTELEAQLPADTDAKDVGRQLYAVLAQLCEGEALDLAQNTQDSNGWEAWRVISKRFLRTELAGGEV